MTVTTFCARIILVMTMLLSAALAVANPDYDAAVLRTKTLTDGLKTYRLEGTMRMVINVKGQNGGREMETDVFAAARYPDRLVSRQQGSGFNLNLGVGPKHSWFYLAQKNVCYLGAPVRLSHDLSSGQPAELSEDQIFNFFAGLGQTLLPMDLEVMPETGHQTFRVKGKDIPCQVFTTPEVPATGQGPREYWFDPDSGLVLKAIVTVMGVRNGMTMEQTLDFTTTGFAVNEPIDETDFAFTAPTGAQVVDQLEKIANPDSMAGEVAPPITFTDLDGNAVSLADYRGKVVFLDFWATWCGPCKMEMPHLQALHEELGARGDVVFLAASNEDPQTIQRFLRKYGYTFKIVRVDPQDAAGKYKATSIPAGFVIDQQGVIKAHLVGAQSEQQLRSALAKAGVGQ